MRLALRGARADWISLAGEAEQGPVSLVLATLDAALTLLHVAVVAACVTLWLSKRARRFHLVLIAIVGVSWFAVGPALGRGVGYCVLTDWQWRIKAARGVTDLPPSFVHLMFRWVGVDDADWMRVLAGVVFVSALLLSVGLNLRDRAVDRRLGPSLR